MAPYIDLPRALLRGRYMAAAAHMERTGIPIDVETLERLKAYWHEIEDALIATVDADYGVFEGRSFKAHRWGQWLERNGIPWPRLDSGRWIYPKTHSEKWLGYTRLSHRCENCGTL